MYDLIFEQDSKKDEANVEKHSVSFEEAKSVFYDEFAVQFYDPDHSEDEDRFILLGTSYRLNTLVVCHCFRKEETVVRIISARKADRNEKEVYWSMRK